MRQAFMLLGIMTLIVCIGGVIAFERAHAPIDEDIEGDTIATMALTLTSPAFKDGGYIPSRFTCDGNNVHPELRIEGVPEGARSLVVLMDDPDIPAAVKTARGIETFVHWVLYNIPPETSVIPEGSVVGIEGLSSLGTEGYVGPCPPDRGHRYIFRLYALSGVLNFVKTPTLREVEQAAQGMELGRAVLMGRYERTGNKTY